MLNNLIDRVRFLFRKDKELYLSLRDIIGFYPHDISYYKLALMHKSVMRRNEKGKPINNERLEFLGDAILDATVGDIVYRHFPGKREGFLTNTRSKLVQRETLNKLAEEMGINRLIMSSGRSSSHNSYMGGNAFEALVGAMYLDRGYDACMKFINKRILAEKLNIDKVAYKEVNFKSKLIEWCQKNKIKLRFDLLNQDKDAQGNPIFKFVVVLETVECCTGSGFSKKESQQKASKLTLERLKKEPQFIDEVFAAKTERTKMEEEPVNMVPDDAVESADKVEEESKTETPKVVNEEVVEEPQQKVYEEISEDITEEKTEEIHEDKETASDAKEDKTEEEDEFDLSDIEVKTEKDMSYDEIIAAAEEAAYKESQA
jgi:ribonuclease-3